MGANERTANDITHVEILTVMLGLLEIATRKSLKFRSSTCINPITGPHNEMSQSDIDKNTKTCNCCNAQESDFKSSYHEFVSPLSD